MHQHGGDIYHHKNVIDFSANINLLGTPAAVIEAACEGVRDSYCYPDIHCSKLRESLSRAIGIPDEFIIFGNGAADLIFSLTVSMKPKKALLPVPSFYEYEQALSAMDCEILCYEMKEEDGFLLREDVTGTITKDLDLLFLCNPNNPTGTLIQPELLEKILIRCEKQGVLLVLDECFMDFTGAKDTCSFIGKCRETRNLFLLKAFTKLYAMPGLRLGYGICGDTRLLRGMREVSQPWNVSVPAQRAGIAALEEKEYVIRSLKVLEEEKTWLTQEFAKLKLKIYGSKANYIFFSSSAGLYEKCLEKGILIRNCSNYRGLGEGYYRIAVKKHEENKQLVQVLKEVI